MLSVLRDHYEGEWNIMDDEGELITMNNELDYPTIKKNLLHALKQHVLDITYEALEGDVQTWRCTLRDDYLPDSNGTPSTTMINNVSGSTNINVRRLDDNRWTMLSVTRIVSCSVR